MATKLNSMRFLERHKVAYEALTFDDAIHDAQTVAEVLGYPPEQVYKTLVVEPASGGKPALAIIAAPHQLDLKKLAAAWGIKKATMAAQRDAERLTGLKVGGISALALTQKNWPVFIDERARQHSHILVSAGQRGTNLRIATDDLIGVLNAQVVQISTTADG